MRHTDVSAARLAGATKPPTQTTVPTSEAPSGLSPIDMASKHSNQDGTTREKTTDLQADVVGPTIFYTRMGIGVFDPRWWEYRIRLFAATTLPSIGRFCSSDAEWIIFVDDDMDRRTLTSVQGLIHAAGLERVVTFAPVQFHFDVFPLLARFASERAGVGKNVGLVRIDDDDALASSFLNRCHSLLTRVNFEPSLISLAAGWEVSLADRQMRPKNHGFMSMNTFFYGPVSLVQSYAQVGHHRLVEWAPRNDLHVIVDSDPSPAFMYMRHKQSDTSFGARRRAILEDEACRFLTQASYSEFGIDQQQLGNWRDHSRTAPSTGPNKTWEISASIVEEASELRKELLSRKRLLRELTSDVFG